MTIHPTSGEATPVTPEMSDRRRFVIWGDDTLAYRLADELLNRHNARITVVMASHRGRWSRRISRLTGVEVIDSDELDSEAMTAADLATADSLALLHRDDVSCMDAAMRAHEANPQLRIVVRIFNTSLGEGLSRLPNCTVLSDSAMAAPAFVAAALGQRAARVRLRADTLDVVHRRDAAAEDILCGLAVTAGRAVPVLLPAEQGDADLVLVRLRRGAPVAGSRRRSHGQRGVIRAVMARVWRRVRLILGVFAGVLGAAAATLVWVRPDLSVWEAVHVTTVDAFGGANPDLTVSTQEQIISTVLSFASIALIPVLTATVVDAVVKSRLELRDGTLARRASGHVVVVGLGGVGSHVLRLLHEQGADVIGIDISADAPGVHVARELDIPFVIGDAGRRETLLAASVPSCRTLMAITSRDAANLETALVGRALRPDLPVVLRLFDGDFADRIQRAFNIPVSRSVSYLAAPSFVARMLGRVLDTISIGRHVLLLADLTVGAYSALESETVGALRRPHEAWIVELTNPDGQRFSATAAAGRRLQRGDQLLVVATRRGLARLIAETTPPSDETRRQPIVLHDTMPFEPPTADLR